MFENRGVVGSLLRYRLGLRSGTKKNCVTVCSLSTVLQTLSDTKFLNHVLKCTYYARTSLSE